MLMKSIISCTTVDYLVFWSGRRRVLIDRPVPSWSHRPRLSGELVPQVRRCKRFGCETEEVFERRGSEANMRACEGRTMSF